MHSVTSQRNITSSACDTPAGRVAQLRRSAAGVLATLAALFAFFGFGVPAAQAQAVVLDHGHMDVFNVINEEGELKLTVKEDVTGQHVIQNPEDVVIEVGGHAFTSQTQNIEGVGVSTYFLPLAQVDGLPWPGWDTFAAAPHESINLVMQDVSGPGSIYLFTTGSFGDFAPILDSGDFEMTSGSVIPVPERAHRHANWAFTAPGTYNITAYAEAEDGTRSNTATYTFEVLASSEDDGSGAGGGGTTGDTTSGDSTGGTTDGNSGGGSNGASNGGSKSGGSNGASNGANNSNGAKPQPAAKSNGASTGGGTAKLANTGSTPGTVPWAVLGIGLLAFGAGVVAFSVAERRRV